MRYTVVSSAEFTYPDIFEYPTSAREADVFSARGGYASWQLLLRDLDTAAVRVEFRSLPEGVTPEIYALRSVMVERNHGIPDEDRKPHWPERIAPYRLYDCLRTFDGTVDTDNKVWQILTNKEMIAINQDPLGVPCRRVRMGGVDVLVKPLTGAKAAVCLFNKTEIPVKHTFSCQKIANEGFVHLPQKNRYTVRDVWEHTDAQTDGKVKTTIAPHGVKVYILA